MSPCSPFVLRPTVEDKQLMKAFRCLIGFAMAFWWLIVSIEVSSRKFVLISFSYFTFLYLLGWLCCAVCDLIRSSLLFRWVYFGILPVSCHVINIFAMHNCKKSRKTCFPTKILPPTGLICDNPHIFTVFCVLTEIYIRSDFGRRPFHRKIRNEIKITCIVGY